MKKVILRPGFMAGFVSGVYLLAVLVAAIAVLQSRHPGDLSGDMSGLGLILVTMPTSILLLLLPRPGLYGGVFLLVGAGVAQALLVWFAIRAAIRDMVAAWRDRAK